jgi:azurin
LKTFSILLLTALSLAARVALADECRLTIEANDLMQYNQKEMHVPVSCKTVQVTLVHTGKLAATVMGHNWVLAKTKDMVPIANDGMSAGLARDYLKPADVRVLAATKLVGGGATTTMSFSTAALKAGEDYSYFCSTPGHYALMKGRFKFG